MEMVMGCEKKIACAFMAVGFGLGAQPVLASEQSSASPERADELDELKSEVAELRELVKSLQAQIKPPDQTSPPQVAMPDQASPETAQAPGEVQKSSAPTVLASSSESTTEFLGVARSPLPPRQMMNDSITGASRIDNNAPPNDPNLRGFIEIPSTSTMFRIGGYAKVDAIYDPKYVGYRDKFAVPFIPTSGSPKHRATINARGTRTNIEVRRPTSLGSLRVFIENDFYGDNDNYRYSLRHAYGQVANIYGGYGFSTLLDVDSLPETLDDWGPSGALWLLTAAIRYSFKLSPDAHISIALEKPGSQISLAPGDKETDSMPDVVMIGRYEGDWGHFQVGGSWRRLGYTKEEGGSEHTTGYELSASGSLKILTRDSMSFGFNYGEGGARYSNDIAGMGYDAVLKPDGDIKALPITAGYGAYTHHWSDKFRSTVVYSILQLSGKGLLTDDDFRQSQYGALNLIWAPTSSLSVGVEGLYGRLEHQDGWSRNAQRVQVSVKYDFVR